MGRARGSGRDARAREAWLTPEVTAVLNGNPNAVVAVDGAGRIAYANAEAESLFGWAAADLVGHPVERLVPASLADRHRQLRSAWAGAPIARPMGIGQQLAARRADGSELAVEISLAPVNEDGVVIATVIDIGARLDLQVELERARSIAQIRVDELEQRAAELARLTELGELLESCQTVEEACVVVERMADALFEGDGGALYILDPAGATLEVAAAWGSPPPEATVFAPDDCWGLRRGRLHAQDDAELACPHAETAVDSLCVPLVANAETMGLLHLERATVADGGRPVEPGSVAEPHDAAAADAAADPDEAAGEVASQPGDHRRVLVEAVGRQVALALAEIRLRASLRDQSWRDPLTGLFNRRYLEETLDRELRRAAREGYSVGLIMGDLDHFKALNDAFGHAAGDETLRRIGSYLAGAIRGGDLACRYGGEEFVLVLPRASLGDAVERAQALREGIRAEPADGDPPVVQATTMSMGVAVYPTHGETPSELLLAADMALYRAKALGRDRVEIASRATESGVEDAGPATPSAGRRRAAERGSRPAASPDPTVPRPQAGLIELADED